MAWLNPLIYARFSDDRKDDSLDVQVRQLIELGERNGVTNAEVIAEDDESAWKTSEERGGRWPEVMQGLADGRWDCLIVRALDRCTRDMIETIQLARLYEAKRFGFIAMNGDTIGDELRAALDGWKNGAESKAKSERLKWRWAEKAKTGEYHPGRWRPFGFQYKFDDRGVRRGLVIDPREAEVVREIAQRLINGESAHLIAVELDRRGVPTVSGAQWQRNMVIRIVKPVSAGLIAHNGQVMPGNKDAPPIITEEEYYQVVEALKIGKPRAPGVNARKHPLAGKLVCARCGVVMQCNGRVYQCTTKNTTGGQRGCGTVTVTKHNVERLILELVVAYLERQDLEVEQTVNEDWSPAIRAAQDELKMIQTAYELKDITAAEWLAGLKVARQRLSEAEEGRTRQLARLTGRTARKMAGSDARERVMALNLSQYMALVGELFEAIVVQPSNIGRTKFEPERINPLWRVEPQA